MSPLMVMPLKFHRGVWCEKKTPTIGQMCGNTTAIVRACILCRDGGIPDRTEARRTWERRAEDQVSRSQATHWAHPAAADFQAPVTLSRPRTTRRFLSQSRLCRPGGLVVAGWTICGQFFKAMFWHKAWQTPWRHVSEIWRTGRCRSSDENCVLRQTEPPTLRWTGK